MKMLGFMIAMTLAYWAMASYAKTLIASADPTTEPTAAVVEVATNDPCDAASLKRVAALSASETKDAGSHHLDQSAAAQTALSCGE